MSDLLLGQPLHHTQSLELVCAAEKCDAWAEIRAGADGEISYFVDTPTRIASGWWLYGRGDDADIHERAGVVIGSLQMFGEEVDWQTWQMEL